MIGGAAVIWKSQRQPCVALSTAEAELVAMTEATGHIIHIVRLLDHLQISQQKPITLVCDSQAAIAIAVGNGASPRRKHIDVKYYYVREQMKEGTINIKWVVTQDQPADILTKPLPVDAFERHRQFIMNLQESGSDITSVSRQHSSHSVSRADG